MVSLSNHERVVALAEVVSLRESSASALRTRSPTGSPDCGASLAAPAAPAWRSYPALVAARRPWLVVLAALVAAVAPGTPAVGTSAVDTSAAAAPRRLAAAPDPP